MTAITAELKAQLLVYQRSEITEHVIYTRLQEDMRQRDNRRVLEQIAADELRHYNGWKAYTGEDVAPDRFKAWGYYWISRVFGFTFGIKLMERGEGSAGINYTQLREHAGGVIPEVEAIIHDESAHELKLLAMLDEELLRYVGSVVLGLNDALVELTGALAGLTLALQNTELIALTGAITGVAAALSMAASEYLSTRSEASAAESHKNPVRAALYTGVAYIATVLALISPYIFFTNYYVCLGLALTFAVLIIALFNYYISVARDEPFRARFVEMAGLSLTVAAISFGVGYLLRAVLGIEA